MIFLSLFDPEEATRQAMRQWERDEKWRKRLPWLFGKPAKSSGRRIAADRLRAVIAQDREAVPCRHWAPVIRAHGRDAGRPMYRRGRRVYRWERCR